MTSYIDPARLRENLSALDSEVLRERVVGGRLTSEAHALALEILAERNRANDLPQKPDNTRKVAPIADRTAQRRFLDRLFVAYILLLVVCAGVVFADPPWVSPHGGGWQGSFGYLAGLVAGLPWTVLAAKTVMTGSALSFWACAGLSVLANITGFLVLRNRTP